MEAEKLQIGYDKALLELSLRIRRGQKIGIIGPNGAGKSTFLKTAAGLLSPVKGKCTLGLNIEMAYFDQQSAAMASDEKVLAHFQKLFPSMTEKEARQYLAGYLFGGSDAVKTIDHLSGGEKSRLRLAEILCARPNFLVLDEPTNHMDIQAKETLESAFRAYKGTMLFVSHDRYFISQVADALLIFENGTATYYPFGYRHYLERSSASDRSGQTDMRARISAEEQALISGLQNVPKGASLLGRELSTEQAFLDWQLRLAEEAMVQSAQKVEILTRELEELRNEAWQQAEWWKTTLDMVQKQEALLQAEADWQEACLVWYDKWQAFAWEEPETEQQITDNETEVHT
jgi:ATP-binding cassette subfamily F protein 3